jgi:hypothetical protein
VFVIVVPLAADAVAAAVAFSEGVTDCHKPKRRDKTNTFRIVIGALSKTVAKNSRKDEMLIGNRILSPDSNTHSGASIIL